MKPCFAVDKSLGTLAKWLRILGYDTLYEADASSGEFYARLEDHRILITRTRKIQKAFASHNHVFITSAFLVEQLKQVVDQIGIKPFTRCIHCNLPIGEVNKNDVYGLVPDYIWQTHDAFNRCSQCQRIYWSGSHGERSLEMVNKIFGSG
jgi:uncharacterized protein with PIN domain